MLTTSATTLVVVVHLPIPEVDICVCNKQKIEEGLLVFPSEDAAITSKETTLFRETSLAYVCMFGCSSPLTKVERTKYLKDLYLINFVTVT